MSTHYRVLHVEDDFADAMLFQHALCEAGAYDYEIIVVRSLHDAAAKLAKRKFDLVIADLRLPDSRDPNATVRALQKSAGDTPIVVLTGSAGVDAEQFFEAGERQDITVLDKNTYFHARSEDRHKALLGKIRGAVAQAEDEGDALIL